VRFNKIKQTYLIGGVAILLLALLSWFFLVSPRMAQASEIGEHRVAVEALNVKSAEQIALLTTLKNGLVKERTVAAALAVKFPPTADQPTLFRQIVTAAGQAGIPEKSITSLGPAAPILGSPSSGAKLPGAAAAPAAAEDGDAAAPAKAAPAKTAENMATMAVSFNAEGTFDQMVKMLKNLENMPRSFLITQVNLSTADKGKFTIAVQGNMYVHRAVPDPGSTAYCAPLRLADEYDKKHPSTSSSVKLGELLAPAASAASGAGRTDVSRFLALMMLANSTDGKQLSVEQKTLIGTAALKAAPTILTECGVDMLRK
jgi:Tfp pilus assembly protein PilO